MTKKDLEIRSATNITKNLILCGIFTKKGRCTQLHYVHMEMSANKRIVRARARVVTCEESADFDFRNPHCPLNMVSSPRICILRVSHSLVRIDACS